MATSTEKQSPVEELMPGLTREWQHDKRLVIFTIASTQQAVLDKWYEAVVESCENWTPGTPYLSIQDFSHPTITVTPYVRHRSNQLTHMFPDLAGRTGVIVSKSMMATLVRGLLQIFNYRENKRVRRIFFTREDALRWLEELIPT